MPPKTQDKSGRAVRSYRPSSQRNETPDPQAQAMNKSRNQPRIAIHGQTAWAMVDADHQAQMARMNHVAQAGPGPQDNAAAAAGEAQADAAVAALPQADAAAAAEQHGEGQARRTKTFLVLFLLSFMILISIYIDYRVLLD